MSGLELCIVHLFRCTPLRGGGDRERDGEVGRGEKCLGEEWISNMDDVTSHMVNYPMRNDTHCNQYTSGNTMHYVIL